MSTGSFLKLMYTASLTRLARRGPSTIDRVGQTLDDRPHTAPPCHCMRDGDTASAWITSSCWRTDLPTCFAHRSRGASRLCHVRRDMHRAIYHAAPFAARVRLVSRRDHARISTFKKRRPD
jgi:hypothetical protein